VQGDLERQLSRILDQPVAVRGSGRTDAGVHALAQWAAFSAPTRHDLTDLERGLNSLLPASLRVFNVQEHQAEIDPRRQARRKTYFYQYHIGRFLPPERHRFFTWAGGFLDLPAMRGAAQRLVGVHDFSSFTTQAARQASCVRHLHSVRVQSLSRGARLYFTGSGFLYNMVRTLSAALLRVGQGRWSADQVEQVLNARDRGQGPPTAPPQGLFLWRVDPGPHVPESLQSDASAALLVAGHPFKEDPR
jgi:tRNA pseudouridine38-40 synthase